MRQLVEPAFPGVDFRRLQLRQQVLAVTLRRARELLTVAGTAPDIS